MSDGKAPNRDNYEQNELSFVDVVLEPDGGVSVCAFCDTQQIALTRRMNMTQATQFIDNLKVAMDIAADHYLKGIV